MVVCLVAVLGALSASAEAQKDAFRDALIGFHANLAGDFGDEAPLVVENLDKLAAALAKWDDTIRSAEQDLRRRLPGASAAESVRIHATLAETYVERARYTDAIGELDAAIQLDSGRGTLHVLRGLALEALGRQEDATGAFRRAWQLDRDDPVSAYLLASRRATQTSADEVAPEAVQLLKALDRRLASVPSDRHIPLFDELALVPDNAAATPVFSPASYWDGFTRVVEGRYEQAIASFRTALARDPLVTGAPARLARLQQPIARLRDGDAEGAIPLLEAAAASTPGSSEIHRILGAAYADAANDGKSIEHFEKAVALAPDDERASVALGRALAHSRQFERAERVLKGAIERLPRSTDAHSALADLYERTDRGRNALHELEAAASFPIIAGKGALYFRLGDLEHRHLEYERVIDPLARRVRLNPNEARAHTDLGLAYTRVGRTNDALVELVAASLIGPDDPETLTAIGQIHFDAGNYAAAETVLRRAVVIAPALVQARYLLGHALARLERARESGEQLAEYDRLRAAANDNARRSFEIDMLQQEAARATESGRHADAVAAWQKVADREPTRPEHHIALAGALRRAGRTDAAIGQLEMAATLDKTDKDVYRQLAELYATLGRTNESMTAQQTYTRLLQEQRRGR